MGTKARAKRHAMVKRGAWTANIPTFNIMDYNGSLMRWCNFFNIEVPGKTKQAWTINYWKDQNKDVSGLEKVREVYFNQTGVLVRLIEDGYEIEPRHLKYLEDKYVEFMEKVGKFEPEDSDEVAEVKKQVTIQDRIRKLAEMHIGEFDNAFDEFCHEGTEFDPKSYLLTQDVKAPVAKRVSDHMKKYLKEFEDARKSKDEQVRESYSHIKPGNFKKIAEWLQDCIKAADEVAFIAKTTRAPRKKKERPASVIAAKLKYMKEYPNLKFKSVPGEKLVGASTVVLFDTKYRKLIQYEATLGSLLSIKGTTLQNFDPKESYSKTVRKPEVLNGIQNMGKRQYNALIKDIRATQGKVTGRINENLVILLVFN